MTNDITELAQIAKIKKQLKNFDTVVLKESEANELVRALEAKDKHIVELNIYRAHRISACVNACEGISTENLINNVPLKEGLRGLNQRIRDADAKLEAAEKRNAELVEALEKAQSAGSINNQWKPDVCPITGRKFFMWIEHPELGYVPTYGGPYDSYTIPTRDSDGEFSCERYDHDVGGWVDGECVGAYLIDDDEQCRVYELEQRITELESRTVKLPEPFKLAKSSSGLTYYYADEVDAALTAAGIKVEAE